LREGRLELRVFGHVNLRGTELARPLGEATHVRADDDTCHLVAERRCLRQHAERRLQQLVTVMLEEDERAHTSRFSKRKSSTACAAFPSSSILRDSPRGGGSFSAYTSVRGSAPSTPRSDSDTVSCGFDFAPM